MPTPRQRLDQDVVETRVRPGDGVYHEVVTVATAGTAVQLPAAPSDKPLIDLVLFAPTANGATVMFVGGAAVTNAGGSVPGVELDAGDAPWRPPSVHRPDNYWVDASVNGGKLVAIGVY